MCRPETGHPAGRRVARSDASFGARAKCRPGSSTALGSPLEPEVNIHEPIASTGAPLANWVTPSRSRTAVAPSRSSSRSVGAGESVDPPRKTDEESTASRIARSSPVELESEREQGGHKIRLYV